MDMIPRPASLVLSSPPSGYTAMPDQLEDHEEFTCNYCQRSYQEILDSEELTVCCPFCPWLTCSLNESYENDSGWEQDTFAPQTKHFGMLVHNEWQNSSSQTNTVYHTSQLSTLCTPDATVASYDGLVTMPVIVMMGDFQGQEE